MYKLIDCYSEEWDFALKEMPINMQDIYYSSEYYKLYQVNGDGIGKLFYYTDKEGKKGFYPFILNKIEGYNLNHDYYDIETAYGYGGPVTSSEDESFLNEFEEAFINFCRDNYIVAEFVRFHPLIHNENIFKKNIQVTHNRNTVYLDLTNGIDRMWNEDIKNKCRNAIRRAERNGLYVVESQDYKTFKYIYYKTMKKVNAEDYYYFHDKYFESMKISSNFSLLNVKREENIIAAAVLIGYGEYSHIHLTCSLKEGLKYSPNNLLFWEAIKYAVSKGYKKIHFGGGLKDGLEDNLFRFKSGFSKEYEDFYIGKRIHYKEIYCFLIEKWEKKYNKKANILLQYRMK